MYKNPCKQDCPERYPGCHATCDKYFVYDICLASERNRRYKENKLEDDCFKTSRHAKKKKWRRRPYADDC